MFIAAVFLRWRLRKTIKINRRAERYQVESFEQLFSVCLEPNTLVYVNDQIDRFSWAFVTW